MRAAALALVCACGGAQPAAPVANVAGVPRMVAAVSDDVVSDESSDRLEIDELSPAGLRRIARVDRMPQSWGWRDAQTLVVLLSGLTDDSKIELYRDGKVTDTIEIKAAEFASDSLGTLAFTKTNEVWLAADCDDTGACKRFLRVLPAPRIAASKPPAGVEPERSAGRWNGHAAPRQVLAPAGIEVGFTRGMNDEGTVTCTSPTGKTSVDHLKPQDVHWVRAQPPIYEVTSDGERSYFRACETTAYAAYRELSDGMWVLSGPMMDVGLMLTFFQGDKQIGQIERGGDFITNR